MEATLWSGNHTELDPEKNKSKMGRSSLWGNNEYENDGGGEKWKITRMEDDAEWSREA